MASDSSPPPGPGWSTTTGTEWLVAPPAPAQPYLHPAGWTAPPPPKRLDGRRILWLAVVIAAIALCGIAVLAYVGRAVGPLALGVGIAAAIIPVPVLVGCFLWLDRYQPNPVLHLVLCFLWGACAATGGALLVNTAASRLFDRWGLSDDLVGVLVAPFIEETLKAAMPILLFLIARRSVTGVVDGIVYCGLSATGFAMVENILYLGGIGFAGGSRQGGWEAGALALLAMFFGRVVLSGFAHPLFTSMTGIGLGVAARTNDWRVRLSAPLAGLLAAMMLHGSWNLMATLSGSYPFVILYGYFAVFVPIFLAMVGLVLWLRSWEGRLAERVLPVYAAAGWFSPPEVTALGTLGRRLSARRWARRVAGDAGHAAMRGYQLAATQLALLRDAMNRGVLTEPRDMARAVADEQRLLMTVGAYREVFTGRDPLTPEAHWNGSRYRVRFPDGVEREAPAPPLPVVPVPFVLTAHAGVAPPAHAPWTPPGHAYR